MSTDLAQLSVMIEKESAIVDVLLAEVGKAIVGQQYVLERLVMGVLTGGHLLLEGVPGLAKTLSIKSLASATDMSFKRVQFTPDLLPSDIVGTLIYEQSTQSFIPKKGPIFAHFILADEINRAPAKVQSALLEAMQEHQVTIGDTSYALPSPFLVLATQNPIDQEGTYTLPEAQVDRFLMKLKVSYPTRGDEKTIMDRMSDSTPRVINPVVGITDLMKAKDVVKQVYVDDKIKDYVLDIIAATRNPIENGLHDLAPLIAFGASPRASIAMIQVAKAHAFIKRRGYVTPEDIKAVAHDVLRHRLIPSFEAEAEEVSSDQLIDTILAQVDVP